MSFHEEPYLQIGIKKKFGSALDVAMTFLSEKVRSDLEKVRKIEDLHYSQVCDAESSFDESSLKAALDEQVPNHEEYWILLAAKANIIMQSGTDGANMPIINIPRMIGRVDPPPDEYEYA